MSEAVQNVGHTATPLGPALNYAPTCDRARRGHRHPSAPWYRAVLLSDGSALDLDSDVVYDQDVVVIEVLLTSTEALSS
jgi:hypothetical protein